LNEATVSVAYRDDLRGVDFVWGKFYDPDDTMDNQNDLKLGFTK